MKLVRQRIAAWTDKLVSQAFFARVGPDADLERMMAFAPAVSFWVLTFQDVIRFNAERTNDPATRRLVEQHLAEDTGHDAWFFEDLERITGRPAPSARWLFSPANRDVRRASSAIASELFHIDDDQVRVVYLEVLEAAAGTYFHHVSEALAAAGHKGKLKYFDGMHIDAEAGHEMHAEGGIDTITIPDALRPRIDALVDRMFGSFIALGDALAASMGAR